MSVSAHTDLHDQPPLAVRAEKLLQPPRVVAKVLSQCGNLGTCLRGLCPGQANALHARPRPHVHAHTHTRTHGCIQAITRNLAGNAGKLVAVHRNACLAALWSQAHAPHKPDETRQQVTYPREICGCFSRRLCLAAGSTSPGRQARVSGTLRRACCGPDSAICSATRRSLRARVQREGAARGERSTRHSWRSTRRPMNAQQCSKGQSGRRGLRARPRV